MGEDRMEVEYRLLLEDAVAFTRQHVRRRRPAWAPFASGLIRAVGLCVAVAVLVDLFSSPFRSRLHTLLGPYYYLVLGFCAGASAATVVLVVRQNLRFAADAKDFERDQRRAGPLRLLVGPEGIIRETTVSRSDLVWAGVPRVVVTNRYVFLYVAQQQAVVVPRRAFPDREEFEKFVALVKGYQQAAQPPADEDAPDD
jgi:hypothetical protein